jgi:RsbT co-antagonist protein rsbRD N-terminal domain
MPTKNSESHQENACGRLADYLQSHKEALIGQWLAQARKDSNVPSESLTKLEIVDHVPKIFDAMILALRKRCSDTAMEDVQEITARHTIIRWVQNYDLQAVLLEVSLLRAQFIRHLLAFENEHLDIGSEARLLNSTTIHSILDDIVMDATDTFLKLRARSEGDRP